MSRESLVFMTSWMMMKYISNSSGGEMTEQLLCCYSVGFDMKKSNNKWKQIIATTFELTK